ncbi:alternate-type signal peptide domain-containing protein [Naasia sp. SYSU D00057]|uniref:alternate-type signal peptide domain-containing protein n=1 Tax=Naasia sp. SYSU D00057 TaxID=2817380 RepID=UPI001B30F7A6|nr:alternate-type signal peptide domain-containing protein [Naasia sp. SYSU D00057]
MNKLVKGSIAGAAGIALLLGGAGTFALWNSTATLTTPSISSGQLSLANNNNGVWKDAAGTQIDPATYRMIPGQTLTYTSTLNVNAVGNGIKANLTYSGLTGSGTLDQYVTKTLEVTSSTATVTGQTLAFTAGASTVNVKLTVTLPQTVTGTQGMSSTLDLSALTFTLAQTL